MKFLRNRRKQNFDFRPQKVFIDLQIFAPYKNRVFGGHFQGQGQIFRARGRHFRIRRRPNYKNPSLVWLSVQFDFVTKKERKKERKTSISCCHYIKQHFGIMQNSLTNCFHCEFLRKKSNKSRKTVEIVKNCYNHEKPLTCGKPL